MRRGMKQLPCFQHVLEKCPKINVIFKSSVCFKSPKERSAQALFAPNKFCTCSLWISKMFQAVFSMKCNCRMSAYNMQRQSRYWAVSAVISNSHVDCWLLYICPKLWARQHNISSCESPGSCSTWGESSVKHYLLNPWMCMKRSWQVAASFPIMPPSLSRSNKNREK